MPAHAATHRAQGQRLRNQALRAVDGAQCIGLDGNAGLYDDAGIASLAMSLRRNGVAAIWSAHDDPAFTKRLRRGGFKVETETVRAHGRKGSRHTIFVAR